MRHYLELTIKRRLGLVLLTVSFVLPANAVVVATNFGPGNTHSNNGILIENRSIRGEVTGFATSFVPSITIPLQDVVLPLSAPFGGALTVGIAADAGGQPGPVITLLTQNGIIGGNTALVAYGCSKCPLLQANTQYWVVAVPTSLNNDVIWHFATSALGNAYFSNDLSNVGAVDGMWSSAGQSFPTPAFLVDGAASAPAPVPALSEFALVLLMVLLTFFGARFVKLASL